MAPSLPTGAQFRRWGVDPGWSRLIDVQDRSGGSHRWHVLDRQPGSDAIAGAPTIVCVHGNPTWSYLWHSFHRCLGDRYRVVAVDQLGMGYSEGTDRRRFAQRVDDLGDVIDALDLDGPVVIAAHDWGGPISLGWAVRNADRVTGIVLCNTGVAVPEGRRAPALIRAAAAGPLTDFVCRRTPTFVRGTVRLSHGRLGAEQRAALLAPYRHADDRRAIADFVDDVPFRASDPSASAVAEVAEKVRSLSMPVLLAWGGRDPVFNDDFAADLASRMPQADRHRFARSGHLVVAEADVAGVVDAWLGDRAPTSGNVSRPPSSEATNIATTVTPSALWSAFESRRDDDATAFVDGARREVMSFAELHQRVMAVATSLATRGVRPGDRVAVLVPPGSDLLAAAYGCWRVGGVTVIADRGLGLRGLRAAIRGARVQWVVGPPKALVAARILRWAPHATMLSIGDLRETPVAGAALPAEPEADDAAAVLYTSGATGPAKGVRYTHGQMVAQLGVLTDTYGITADDRLVAAFAPFALYGPALGIASTIPDVDVTRPGTLTAEALAEAVDAIEATIVFAAPAALANVVRTAPNRDSRLSRVRLVLSAGAPVPIATLRATAALCPAAELHTPYGMTECLPVADIELAQIDAAGSGDGVCVGWPVPGAAVAIAPLGFDALEPIAHLCTNEMGEVMVRTPWLSAGYDQLWRTEHDARPVDRDGATWHRTGDVGHLDEQGRLWIEGRSVHVIHTVAGPLTPVPVEVAVERLNGVERAAAVGVGPVGCQQLVIVLEGDDDGLATEELSTRVRAAVDHPVAAVLTVTELPVDIRHNTKIDRAALARWASALLAGERAAEIMVKVLVTGASSLLARRTVELLLHRGDEVVCLQRHPAVVPAEQVLADIRDADAVKRAAAGCDAVIHAAAKVGVVGDWQDYRSINVDGTAAVLAAARRAGASRIVHVSSPAVAHHGEPIVGDGAAPAVTGRKGGAWYPESKALAERLALAAASAELAVVAIRPHLVWGPEDTQLVGRIVDRARGGRLALVGGGEALVDTTYIECAAESLVAALDAARPEAACNGRAYVVANGEPRPVRDLVLGICRAAGLHVSLRSVPRPVALVAGSAVERVWRLSGASSEPILTRFLAEQLGTAHWFDPRPAHDELGWSPSVSIDEGLRRLSAWFQQGG